MRLHIKLAKGEKEQVRPDKVICGFLDQENMKMGFDGGDMEGFLNGKGAGQERGGSRGSGDITRGSNFRWWEAGCCLEVFRPWQRKT